MENKTHEKAGALEVMSRYAHDEPMASLFKNIFHAPAQGGRKWLCPEGVKVPVLDSSDPALVPPAHDDYCFRKDLLRTLLAFLTNPHASALYITGPTGSGKTSLVSEVCARLNWPLDQLTMNERFEFAALRGTWSYRRVQGAAAPEMVFQDGPLTSAMRGGHVLLLNEVDIAPAGEMSGMNDIIEGRPLMIPETGEIVRPHPLFRVIVTANSKGGGDDTGCYAGIQQQNVAAMDRYRFLEVGYPDPQVETALIENIFSSTLGSAEAKHIAGRMVDLANKVRNEFIGLKGIEGTIHVPISTRCLATWAYLALDYFGSNNALKEAFHECYLRRCNAPEAQAVNDMAAVIFGEVWNRPTE